MVVLSPVRVVGSEEKVEGERKVMTLTNEENTQIGKDGTFCVEKKLGSLEK